MKAQTLLFTAIVMALATIFISCNNKGDNKLATEKSIQKLPVQNQPNDTVAIAEADTDTTTQNKVAIKTNIQSKTSQKYFLITDSFEIKSNAEKLAEKLKNEGFDVRIIPTNFGMYRVSYRGFSDRKEAFDALKEEQKAGKIVWLNIVSKH